MRRMCIALLLALSALSLSSAVWGQRIVPESVVHDIATSRVHGIKIVSSSYDPKTHSGNIEFMNVTDQPIVSFGGQVIATDMEGRDDVPDVIGSSHIYINALIATRQKRYPTWDLTSSLQLIRPGGTHTQAYNVGYGPGMRDVSQVAAVLDSVVYANHTVDFADQGKLQKYFDSMRELVRHEKEMLQMADDVMAAQVAHPTAVFLKALRDHHMIDAEHAQTEFEHPSPVGEKEKLTEFVSLHQDMVKIFQEFVQAKVVAQ